MQSLYSILIHAILIGDKIITLPRAQTTTIHASIHAWKNRQQQQHRAREQSIAAYFHTSFQFQEKAKEIMHAVFENQCSLFFVFVFFCLFYTNYHDNYTFAAGNWIWFLIAPIDRALAGGHWWFNWFFNCDCDFCFRTSTIDFAVDISFLISAFSFLLSAICIWFWFWFLLSAIWFLISDLWFLLSAICYLHLILNLIFDFCFVISALGYLLSAICIWFGFWFLISAICIWFWFLIFDFCFLLSDFCSLQSAICYLICGYVISLWSKQLLLQLIFHCAGYYWWRMKSMLYTACNNHRWIVTFLAVGEINKSQKQH